MPNDLSLSNECMVAYAILKDYRDEDTAERCNAYLGHDIAYIADKDGNFNFYSSSIDILLDWIS